MKNIKLFIITGALLHVGMGFSADILANIERLKSLPASKLSCSEFIKAAKEGDKDMIKRLLDGNVDSNVRGAADPEDFYGPNGNTTALIVASEHGHKDIVEMLLDHGANPNLEGGAAGITALMAAANKGHKDIVKLLLDKGANPHIRNVWKTTALDLAKKNGNQAIVALIEAAIK